MTLSYQTIQIVGFNITVSFLPFYLLHIEDEDEESLFSSVTRGDFSSALAAAETSAIANF